MWSNGNFESVCGGRPGTNMSRIHRILQMIAVIFFTNIQTSSGIHPEVYGYVNSNVTLTCGVSVEGELVQLRWYKENGHSELLYDLYNNKHRSVDFNLYNITDGGNDLTIHKLTLKDESKYRCSVTDETGIKETYMTLLLLGE